MLTKPATFDLTRFGERNMQIMQERRAQHSAELSLMLDVNEDWYIRTMRTPDVAMCLGRYLWPWPLESTSRLF